MFDCSDKVSLFFLIENLTTEKAQLANYQGIYKSKIQKIKENC